MGREVRLVPPDWKHPQCEYGGFHPMHDRSYKAELAEWEAGLALWLTTTRAPCRSARVLRGVAVDHQSRTMSGVEALHEMDNDKK